MDKEELERFMVPFTSDVKIVIVANGRYHQIKTVRYEMVDGEGHIVLVAPTLRSRFIDD